MKRSTTILIATGLLSGVFRLAAAPAAAPAAVVPTVSVEEVKVVESTEPQTYVGTVAAADTVDIVARISGTLEQRPYKEGSMVKKGDLLFKLEDTVYKANVRSSKSVLSQMKAEFTFAQREFDRYKKLLETQATAQTNYDSSLRTLKYYEAKIEEAEAALILAENDLSYTRIYAPIDGRVGANIYSEGNYITPGKGTLVTIVRYDPIKIKFSMSEADYFRHFEKDGDARSEIEIFRADGRKFQTEVSLDFIDNQVDANTGTLMIQFKAANPKMELIPGGYVTVKFSDKLKKPLPAVNVAALMSDGKSYFVYVVGKDNVVEKREVKVGQQAYDHQMVLSGLSVGEKVVVGGLHKAIPGKTVNPVALVADKR